MRFGQSLQSPAFILGFSSICGAVTALEPWLCFGLWLLFGLFFIRNRWICFLAFALYVTVGARVNHSLQQYVAAHASAAALLQEPLRCAFLGKVLESPTVRLQDNELTVRLLLSTDLIDCEGRQLQAEELLVGVTLQQARSPDGLVDDWGRGDLLSIVAQLAPVRGFNNQAVSSPWPRLARRGALYSGTGILGSLEQRGAGFYRRIDAFRSHVRRRIVQSYHPQAQALGRALVLGENDLNQSDYQSFQQSGLMHLLAVSGTHLVIAVVGLMSLLRAVLTRINFLSRRYDIARFVYAFGGSFSLIYADFSGGSGSARRAALMLTLISIWRVSGRKLSGINALGSSLVVGVLLWPLRGLDYSFLLSALATLGLLFIGQPCFRALTRRFSLGLPLRWLAGSVVATISSTLPCLPLLCAMSGTLTWAALVGNILAGPLGELIALPACLVHTVCALWPALESGLAALGSGALLSVRAVALWSGELDAWRFQVRYPGNAQIIWCLELLLIWFYLGHWFRWIPRSLLLCAVLFLFWQWPRQQGLRASGLQARLSVAVLDVGQGDALLVRKGEFTLLMDAGGYVLEQPDTGARVVSPYLRAQGISRLNVIAASHDHPDHINGLLSVVLSEEFNEFWWPGEKKPSQKMRQILQVAESKGVKVRTARELCGDESLEQSLGLRVIWPCDAPSHLSQNDLSLVLHIKQGERAALLTGDVEYEAEALILKAWDQLEGESYRADFLKVAHHGSHTSSTPQFLKRVRPRFAVASAGVRNRFGHPRKQTLARLKARGVTFFDTMRDGSVTWSTDGEKEWITTVQAISKRQVIPPMAK